MKKQNKDWEQKDNSEQTKQKSNSEQAKQKQSSKAKPKQEKKSPTEPGGDTQTEKNNKEQSEKNGVSADTTSEPKDTTGEPTDTKSENATNSPENEPKEESEVNPREKKNKGTEGENNGSDGNHRAEEYRPKKKQPERKQVEAREPTMTDDKVKELLKTLREYKDGKSTIDKKATENQEWWRLRHWNVIKGQTEAGKAHIEVGSGWAVNSILNKHADIMDSYPKPNVLAREADDEMEANILSKILPAIEEQTDAEYVYNQAGYDFLLDGTAVTAILWDPLAHDGMGDIRKTNIDIHNVFWQPGIDDIQDSKYFFHVSTADIEDVKVQYCRQDRRRHARDNHRVYTR